jgi:hypothetical protein
MKVEEPNTPNTRINPPRLSHVSVNTAAASLVISFYQFAGIRSFSMEFV